jgi:dishevelled associated activator of morphogenesis
MAPLAPKKPAKPKKDLDVKVKAFNWSKIPDTKVDGSIWEKDVTDDGVEVDVSRLVELFSAPKKEEKADGGGEGVGKAKAKKPTVLDPQRSNNINIIVRKFRKTPQELVAAILQCDEEFLSTENIQSLLKIAPTSDDMELLKEYSSDDLPDAEKYLLALGDVPQLEARLTTLMIKNRFEKRLAV